MRLVLMAILSAILTSVSVTSGAQQLSPYSAFASLSPAQLAGTQVRFTYVGSRLGGFGSVAFTTTGQTLNVSGFIPYYRPDYAYSGDGSVTAEFTVSTSELERMIDSIGTVAPVAAGDADSLGVLSFGLFVTVNGQPQCFEAIVDTAVGSTLFTKALQALAPNAAAVNGLSSFACSMGLLDGEVPHIVDSQVQISLSGFRRIRDTSTFAGRLRLKNTSGSALNVPLAAAVEFVGDVRLLSPTGRTCFVAPSGLAYVRLPATSQLAPGATTEVVVQVDNPGLVPVRTSFARAFVDSGGH